MKAPQSFIVTPKHRRYKEGKKIGDVTLAGASSVEDAKDVSKEAIVVAVPMNYNGDIEPGDEVIVHHNIFRSYYDVTGKLKVSRAHLYDDYFQAIPEELFLYKKNGEWKPNEDFCFVAPIKVDENNLLDQELQHTGVVWASNEHKEGTRIGFTPDSEYEVWVDGLLLYRMRDSDICLYVIEE